MTVLQLGGDADQGGHQFVEAVDTIAIDVEPVLEGCGTAGKGVIERADSIAPCARGDHDKVGRQGDAKNKIPLAPGLGRTLEAGLWQAQSPAAPSGLGAGLQPRPERASFQRSR